MQVFTSEYDLARPPARTVARATIRRVQGADMPPMARTRTIRIHARVASLALVAFAMSAAFAAAQDSEPPMSAPVPAAASDPVLERARGLLDAARAAQASGDPATARERTAQATDDLLADDAHRERGDRIDLLFDVARVAWDAGDAHVAHKGWALVDEVRTRTLPADHPDLQSVRQGLALAMHALGDLTSARALEEQVLEVRTRTLPADHPELQVARVNLASTMFALGDTLEARALFEQVEKVYSRTLPADHLDLQRVRHNLAATISELGDLPGARALNEQVVNAFSRTLPADHPDLLAARQNLALTMKALGDLAGARSLEEQILDFRIRTLPPDHPALQAARNNLAVTLFSLGDLPGARVLQELVLEVFTRTVPADHPDLHRARQNLALTMHALGDLSGAMAIEEVVLEARSRSLSADHPDVQAARQNLAMTMHSLGDLPGARALEEQVLEVCTRTLPADHPDLQLARENLAATIGGLGDFVGARALQEEVLRVRSRALPADHPYLQTARGNLASTIVAESAQANAGQAGARKECAGLMVSIAEAQIAVVRGALYNASSREAEERCVAAVASLDNVLSGAAGFGVFARCPELEAPAFLLSETARGAAIISASLARRAGASDRARDLRAELSAATEELARLGTTGATATQFDVARARLDAASRVLVNLAREQAGGSLGGIDLGLASLAERLDRETCAVAFRRYRDWRVSIDESETPSVAWTISERLCAFVLRGRAEANSSLMLVELGPIEPIELMVMAWRSTVGGGDGRGKPVSQVPHGAVGKSGRTLCALVLDPLLPAIGDAKHLVVVMDDVLHLVPLDALPIGDGDEVVGDRYRIDVRSTLAELYDHAAPIDSGGLIALGGVAFNLHPLHSAAEESASLVGDQEEQPTEVASILRGSPSERGFDPLTYTADEVRGIGALHADAFGDDRPALVLDKAMASRASLVELAPQARFLHVATHGWYAPESIPSWRDPEPLDAKSGLAFRMSTEERIRGMSPMLLCGLALAGANLKEDAVGRAPGLITAEEISTLDLSNCELAVLSACDTNVGVRRAGQGVASLQRALQMAGARSVITSLWKVRDEPTKDFMLDFYRRLWIEKKPKHQALWEAKQKLRHAHDADGRPLYTVRDWAAWVLTGEPE